MNYKELLEDYKEMLSKYCYAIADVPIKIDKDGNYYVDEGLKGWLYVVGGNFESDMVADEIMQGDSPFEGVDKEGYWHFEFLLKYYRGGHEDPSYMEQLLVESSFQCSFEEMKIENARMADDEINW